MIRALNLGNQHTWRTRGGREGGEGGGWGHFAEKVCHREGGDLKGLGGAGWAVECCSRQIEQFNCRATRNLDVLMSFKGFAVAGMESMCGDTVQSEVAGAGRGQIREGPSAVLREICMVLEVLHDRKFNLHPESSKSPRVSSWGVMP